MRHVARLLLACLFAASFIIGTVAQTRRPLVVFAAASLKDAFDEAGAGVTAKNDFFCCHV